MHTSLPEVSPGFPLRLARDVLLLDGRTVLVRPDLPDDAGELRRAVEHTDPGTLRRRLLGGRIASLLGVTLLPFSQVGPFAGILIDR